MTLPMRTRIAALLTSFNRREQTLVAVDRLFRQSCHDAVDLSVFLMDDGSTDGTSEAIAQAFPQVNVLKGSGALFWNGGMRQAFEAALATDFDYYLWLNDDSNLYPEALKQLLAVAKSYEMRGEPAIVTGTMRSPTNGQRTYGGQVRRVEGLKVNFHPVDPDPHQPVECDTMNGNFVLIPRAIANAVGNLDPVFRHQIGDLDYGLRAGKAGFCVVVAPGFQGECDDNSRLATWRDRDASLQTRWKHLMSPKGAPPREWITYVRRHFGWRWPIYAVSPYLKTLLKGRIAARKTHR